MYVCVFVCVYICMYCQQGALAFHRIHTHNTIYVSYLCMGVFYGECHINLGVVVMHYITLRAHCK